jgi:hypothetical protein
MPSKAAKVPAYRRQNASGQVSFALMATTRRGLTNHRSAKFYSAALLPLSNSRIGLTSLIVPTLTRRSDGGNAV